MAPQPDRKDYQTEPIDPTGRYVVGWANSNTIYATVLWDNGTPQDRVALLTRGGPR